MSIRRMTILCTALVSALMLVLCRVFWIAADTGYARSAAAQTISETVLPVRRGDFYDRTGRRLTGWKKTWYALCIPGDFSYAALFPLVTFAAQTELYEKRNSVTPFLIEVASDLSDSGIFTVQSAQRCLPTAIAQHLIGYLDGEGHGVTGLEKAYDDLLAAAGDEQAVRCTTSAVGELMAGEEPAVTTRRTGTGASVTLTLDADIQRACEAAAREMTSGCIVVMKPGSGELLASVSVPAFDPDNVAASIEAADTSLINRVLSAYSAGSVFKVVLAAAAYENGLDWFTHDCTGSIETAGETFRCAQGRAHGTVNLRGALEQSCNSYFVALGQLLGGQAVRQTAERFGFGTAAALAPGLKSAAGALPDAAALQNAGELASLSFGQGSLTVTPLQVAAMMNAVAGDGTMYRPAVVLHVDDASGTAEPESAASAACTADVARVLRSMLTTVVSDGIGGDAQPSGGTAGGKTGTAQTGQFDENGEELLNYWFSGFFPADAPQYTITVLQDAQHPPQASSAKIFAAVAQSLQAMGSDDA